MRHFINRMKLVWKLVKLAPRAREIELEWQKIQQEENDQEFAFRIRRGSDENMFHYKKGISEGVKWVFNRFS